MKIIGLIGGMSWESSAIYYKGINEKIQEKLGGVHSARCLLYSVDFAHIAHLQHAGDWAALSVIMVDAAQRLESAGADFIVLCTNTMHKLAGDIEKNIGIPFIHIVDATAEAIKAAQLKKVGLLGTKFTMEEDFLKDRLLNKHQVESIIPSESQRAVIHQIIYEELVKGIFSDASRNKYVEIINDLTSRGAAGIILGCTEIGLLIDHRHTAAILFDTTLLHVNKAVEVALSAVPVK